MRSSVASSYAGFVSGGADIFASPPDKIITRAELAAVLDKLFAQLETRFTGNLLSEKLKKALENKDFDLGLDEGAKNLIHRALIACECGDKIDLKDLLQDIGAEQTFASYAPKPTKSVDIFLEDRDKKRRFVTDCQYALHDLVKDMPSTPEAKTAWDRVSESHGYCPRGKMLAWKYVRDEASEGFFTQLVDVALERRENGGLQALYCLVTKCNLALQRMNPDARTALEQKIYAAEGLTDLLKEFPYKALSQLM